MSCWSSRTRGSPSTWPTVYVIDQGIIQFEGTADELVVNDAMQRQFLTV